MQFYVLCKCSSTPDGSIGQLHDGIEASISFGSWCAPTALMFLVSCAEHGLAHGQCVPGQAFTSKIVVATAADASGIVLHFLFIHDDQ